MITDWQQRRALMVAQQLQARGIRDRRVLDAMGRLLRERFIPEEMRELAYEDRPIPIGHGQTISQPYIVGLMTQELAVEPGQRVLDIGCGSGYQAAILGLLAGQVYAVERVPELAAQARLALAQCGADNVTVVVGDGTLGLAEHAPYDRILCGAAGPEVPPAWLEQLLDGGRIVMPLGTPEQQELVAIEKRGGQILRRTLCGVRFVPLIGEHGWPG